VFPRIPPAFMLPTVERIDMRTTVHRLRSLSNDQDDYLLKGHIIRERSFATDGSLIDSFQDEHSNMLNTHEKYEYLRKLLYLAS
jgi:hypothetical protein